ncbi:hypothetical protein A2917_02870 [Candidatus Nomurabacteria bacterium RIFCSPLOWO2_01_FULL_42_17]|uniref:DUF5673 domain-containing protein n=1 Tax=Candidatus Nomurabacteria bacterium RIFCSPLOWO2_01_FULL_42_17 TaxID=1801780 RepID=A0A1F6XMX4_9BACT|nr:MAG: hypothetical protein A2917_02870 [Candidatus Nomurabacteria bacterium RIFCSPLOWO2_01_FULL_42_17]
MEKLEWSALEYEEKERSRDWFWALGIIVATSSIAAMIFGNYFFAVLLILSGVLLGFFAIKKPEMVHYELNNQGLKIRTHLYPYERIKSFWVQIDKSGERKVKPTLFIKSERAFMPVIEMPIEYIMADDIHAIMLSKNIAEEEMKEHTSLKIMESLGF